MLIALVRNLPFPDRTPLFYFFFLASAEARVKRSAERWRLAIRDATMSRVEVSEGREARSDSSHEHDGTTCEGTERDWLSPKGGIRVDWRMAFSSRDRGI